MVDLDWTLQDGMEPMTKDEIIEMLMLAIWDSIGYHSVLYGPIKNCSTIAGLFQERGEKYWNDLLAKELADERENPQRNDSGLQS